MSRPSLDRRLGPFDAAAIIVSNVIGSGIFLTPAVVAALTGDAIAMVGVWLVGGFIAFAGAMAYAELAALRPHAGGEYVYLRAAFGPIAAFLTGWTSFVAGFSGAVAASAVGFASYLGRFVPTAGDTRVLASLPLGPIAFTVTPQALVAIALIGGLTWIHVRGVGPGRVVQNILAGLKVTGLVALIVFGFSFGDGSWAHFQPARRRSGRRRVPPGAGAGDVQLFGLERGVVRRRGNPPSRALRAAVAGRRHRGRRRALSLVERALRLLAAGRRARRHARKRDGSHRGAAVRAGQPAT